MAMAVIFGAIPLIYASTLTIIIIPHQIMNQNFYLLFGTAPTSSSIVAIHSNGSRRMFETVY